METFERVVGTLKQMTRSYSDREPWRENYQAHERAVESRRAGRRSS